MLFFTEDGFVDGFYYVIRAYEHKQVITKVLILMVLLFETINIKTSNVLSASKKITKVTNIGPHLFPLKSMHILCDTINKYRPNIAYILLLQKSFINRDGCLFHFS